MTGPGVPAPHVLSAHLGEESVLLDLEAKRYFRLNESAAVIWRAIEHGVHEDAIVARLVAEFEVAERDARDAVSALVGELRARKLVRARDGA
jgi:hypothetical protein